MVPDIKLIYSVREGDNQSLIELVSRHEKLYFKLSRFLNGKSNFDFEREKYHFFHKVAKDYDPKRGMKFSSFLGQRTRFLCKGIVSQPNRNSELTDEIPAKSTCNQDEETISTLHTRIKQINDPRAKRILLARYFDKSGKVLPFARIAPRLKMSTRNVKYIHDRYINILKNYV